MTMPAIPLSERDQIEHMLARQFYLHFCEHRKSDPHRPPYVPAWASTYASIATTYLTWDDESVTDLTGDYK